MKNRFVYLMRCNTFYKIGISTQVGYRLMSIQACNPYPVELVARYKRSLSLRYEFSFNDAYQIERHLHKVFKEARGFGEWFELTPDHKELFNAICRNPQAYIEVGAGSEKATCANCGEPFPRRVAQNGHVWKYCSNACRKTGRKAARMAHRGITKPVKRSWLRS